MTTTYTAETDCGPRPEDGGPWKCAKCRTEYAYSVRVRCPGAPPPSSLPELPIGDCPIIGEPCDQLCLTRNGVAYFCRRDLLAIEESCGDARRAKAVAVMARRAAGRGESCPLGRQSA